MGESDDKIQQQILQRYQIVKKIGCGAYGVVWKVIDKKYKTIHALKKNFDAFQNSTDAQRTYREIMFLQQFKHPNIVALQKIIKAQNEKDIYLVFQFMDIDLYTLIRQNILEEKHKRYIIYQVAKAIFYLHTGQLIHRDIKPSNILVNQSCLAKMCDFGLVRSVEDQEEQQPFLTQYIATRWYRAPQILLGSKKYSKAVDVWSFGCLIGQIIKGRPLFPGNSTLNQIQRVLTWTGPPTISDMKSLKTDFGKQMLDLLSKIKKINKNQWFQNVSNSGYDLLTKTLQFNPEKRISMLQVLQHPYLREFYNQEEIIRSDSKIRVPVDDNKKLSTKDYKSLIYKNIKQTQQQGNNSLVSSLGPSKILVQKKSQSNEKEHSQNFQRQGATKTVHKNRMFKGTVFNQTSTQKCKIHSLGTSNKSIIKKGDQLNQFKKNMESSKKYESLINKRKDFTKTKYIKTQQKQREESGPASKYMNSNQKNQKQHHNIHNGDLFGESQTNSRFASSADKGKKSVSLNEGRRQSQVIAKYMYKHKYF